MPRQSAAKLTRRELLQAGALAGAGLSLSAVPASASRREVREKRCIFINLVGGPSHLDTWDPKPDAASEIRGPFQAISTNVPGIRISELFPRMARMADRFALVRSVHHTGPAIHDVGHQMLQTGRLFEEGVEHPHLGSVLAYLHGGMPPVVLPAPIGHTGGNLPHGQTAGFLGAAFEPLVLDADPSLRPITVADLAREGQACEPRGSVSTAALELTGEPEALRQRYGLTRFGQSCLLARRLVERGTRFVTVNMYETVFNETTWDCHGCQPFSTLDAYRDTVGPSFDQAYSTLLEDLATRGLLEDTLVVATGEFGRTPRLNPAGGRDHWTRCWTLLMAGGGVRGGQVIGASDATGAEPKERPVTPAEVTATVYHALGVDPGTRLPGPDGASLPLLEPGTRPILELF